MSNTSDETFVVKHPLKHLDIDMTRQCNWECLHCSATAGAHVNVSEELTKEEIKSILRQGKALGVEDVGFTGGEPLLRNADLLHLLIYSKRELKVKTHLLTNGSLIEKIGNIMEIISYVDRLRVTFLGLEETHDKLTRTPGAYKAVINGIKILQDLGANFFVALVPMKQNYKELPVLVKTLHKDHGISRFRLLDLAPTGKAMEIWEDISLKNDEKIWLDNELRKISFSYQIDISEGFHTGLTFYSPKRLKGHEFCWSGLTRCHVNAVGDVFPCTAATGQPILSAGNLRKFNLDLGYIWRSAPVFLLLRYFREHPPSQCSKCERWTFCAGGCRVEMNYRYGSSAISDPECEIVREKVPPNEHYHSQGNKRPEK